MQVDEAAVSFETMPFDELLLLRQRLDNVIAGRISAEERELEARLARIKQLKTPLAVSLNQGGAGEDTARRKLPPRYRNPENPSQTWAGRGLQPRWLKDAMKSGRKKLSDFLVTEFE